MVGKQSLSYFYFNDTATAEIYTVLTHSFPTRRSSDLSDLVIEAGEEDAAQIRHAAADQPLAAHRVVAARCLRWDNEMKFFSGDGDADLQGACHAGCGWERPQPRGRGSCCQNATWCRFRPRKRAVSQVKRRRRP